MRNPSYLELSRHRVFYFRFPVLDTSNAHKGPPRTIKVSLHTRVPKEALYLSRQLRYAGDILAKRLANTNMRYDEIRATLKRHFQFLLEQRKAHIAEHGRLSHLDVDVIKTSLAAAQERIAGIEISPGEIDELATRFVDHHRLPIEPGTNAHGTLKAELQKAYAAYCSAVLDHDKAFDSYDLGAVAAPIADALSKTGTTVSVSLRQLAENFIGEETLASRWAPRSEDQKRQHIELLQEALGADKPANRISAEDAQFMKQMLMKYPRNRNKLTDTRSLTIAQIMELTGHTTLTIRTINTYLQTYSAMFAWAKRNRYVSENVFDGATVRENKKLGDEAQRDAFTPAQIETMFDELLSNRRGLITRDYQKWGPLIGLYTGARLNEICQIQIADIKQVDGISCFDLNDDGDNKRLKNAASRRIVPIHDRLIELGLLDYVEQLRRKGVERLFPDFAFSRKEGYGRPLGRWFNNRFLVKLGIKSKDLVFHSFRHTMVTTLMQAGVDDYTVKALVGHKRSGVTHEHYFKLGYTVAQLKAALQKF